MSISSLATIKVPAYTGNYTKGRSGKKITEITIHHMAGRFTAQKCGEIFQRVGREGSSHYGIGYDGVIANYVDENDTAWTNSNWDANCRSVTIETANDSTGGDWPVNDVTLRSLINLVADIAVRNNLGTLVKGKNLTFHQMYSATACPGPYLISKLDYIIQEANKIINNGSDVITTNTPVDVVYQVYTTQWLGNISQHNPNDANNGYAGIFGRPITGVYVNASVGNVYYKVHTKPSGWLPEVKNREDYAGIFGQPIDGILIKSDSTILHYQVHTQEDGWLPAINGYNVNDPNNGYAGILGHTIDGLMVWADDIVTTTVVEKPKVESPPVVEETQKQQVYRVRTDWNDLKSQVGAYKNLQSAIDLCNQTTLDSGEVYHVYDVDGNIVHSGELPINVPSIEPEVNIPDIVEDEIPNVTIEESVIEPPTEEPIIDSEESKQEGLADLIILLLNNIIKIIKSIFKH